MPTDTPAPGPRWWFVYYRVRRAELDAAAAAAKRAQSALCQAQPGLVAQLMHRPSSDADEVTLLETYALTPAAGPHQAPDLAAAIEAALAPALAPWQRSARRVEVFTPCA